MLDWEASGELWNTQALAERARNRAAARKGPRYVSEVMVLEAGEYAIECFGYVVWTPKASRKS